MNEQITNLQKQIMELKGELRQAQQQAEPQPMESHEFTNWKGETVTLEDLFDGRDELIVIHNMGKGCRWCTLWADGLNGQLAHLQSRASVVMVNPDDAGTQQEFAASRGWNFRMVTDEKGDFSEACGFKQGADFGPGVSAFVRRDGQVVRTGFSWFGPGDDFCAPYPIFDLLPGGSESWEPQYNY